LSSDEEQMKKIYDSVLLSTDSTNKKKGVKALASYGKKAIPFIQELRSIETELREILEEVRKLRRRKRSVNGDSSSSKEELLYVNR
jgi:hypothetical protein